MNECRLAPGIQGWVQRFSTEWILSFCITLLLSVPVALANDADHATSLLPASSALKPAQATLPFFIVPNAGQASSQIRYHTRGPGFKVYFTENQAVLVFEQRSKHHMRTSDVALEDHPVQTSRGVTLALRFLDANSHVRLQGGTPDIARVNYLIGDDASKWQRELPTFRELKYQELWPGVDLIFKTDGTRLKYEFVLEPGASVEQIQLAYNGAESLAVDSAGNLVIKTPLGVVTDARPTSYQLIKGKRVPLKSRFALLDDSGKQGYGFSIGADYDPRYPLVIDPALEYSTLLGGSADDTANAIAVDALGNVYVTGETASGATIPFPTTAGAHDTTFNGPTDAFVAKLNQYGDLIYATYLGGRDADVGFGIAVDNLGNAYVSGQTESRNFPKSPSGNAFDSKKNGTTDGFVTKLGANGATILYSTYLGGGGPDSVNAIDVDADGYAYVSGQTQSSNFPTTSQAVFPGPKGGTDGFVTRLNPSGSALVYSTYLGGGANDAALGIALDGYGGVFVTGRTQSGAFPTTTNAFRRTLGGVQDAFVTRLNPTLANGAGADLSYSTYLGGNGIETGFAAATDAMGNVYVAGQTTSNDPGTPFFGLSGASDAFVSKINFLLADGTGADLVYNVYLGGNAGDLGLGISVDDAGSAYVGGETSSDTGFPLTDAVDESFDGSTEAFVARLDAANASIIFATYLGGSGDERANAIAVDAAGSIYVSGRSSSSNDFPVPDTEPLLVSAGASDAFVVKITANASPIALDDTATTDEDTGVVINAAANDTDSDDNLDLSSANIQCAGCAGPIHGALLNNGDGSFHYTPQLNYNGSDSFIYEICDTLDACDTATVAITVNAVNDAPIALDDESGTDEDTPLSVAVLANDSDVDGDTLALQSVTQPANGEAVAETDDTVTYTPNPNFNGIDTFTYTLNDGSGGSDTATVTITVAPVNDAPQAGDDSAGTNEDTAVTVFVLDNDADVDLDSLSVTSASDPLNGTTVVNGGVSVSYTPDSDFNGVDTFSYTIDDGNGGNDTATVTVTVAPVNDPPTATAPTPAMTDQGVPVILSLTGLDIETSSADLTFTLGAAAHGTLSTVTPTANGIDVTYTPDARFGGTDSFDFTVTDRGDPDQCGAPSATCAAPLESASATADITVVGNTAATARFLGVVLIGGTISQRLGDIEITERFAGALSDNGRVTLTLPACVQFDALPSVFVSSAGYGLEVDLSASSGPVLDDNQTFSFALLSPSSAQSSSVRIANISVMVDACFGGGAADPVPVLVNIGGTNSGITSESVHNADAFARSDQPRVSDTDPNQAGQGAVDYLVSVFGLNFQANSSVTFCASADPSAEPGTTTTPCAAPDANISVTDVALDAGSDTTQLSVIMTVNPNATVGLRDVTVTNIASGKSATLINLFEVKAAPTVTATDRTGADALFLGGQVQQRVNITGSGFQPPTTYPPNLQVEFSGTGVSTDPSGVAFVNDTEIWADVLVDADAPLSSRTVTVINPDGGRATSGLAIVDITADPPVSLGAPPNKNSSGTPQPPAITALNPAAALRGGVISIVGTNFENTASNNTVNFAGPGNTRIPAVVQSGSSTSLSVVVPAQAADGSITVRKSDGLLSNPFVFTVTNPLLASVIPAAATADSSASLMLIGSKFESGATVAFSNTGIALDTVTFVDPNRIDVDIIINAGASGFSNVTVSNPGGGVTTRVNGFEVRPATGLTLDLSLLDTQGQPVGTATYLPGVAGVEVSLDGAGACNPASKVVTPGSVTLRAVFTDTGGSGASAPAQVTLTLDPLVTSAHPGTASNEDCESSVAVTKDFSLACENIADCVVGAESADVNRQSVTVLDSGGGVYLAVLDAWDWAASTRIQVTGIAGNGATVTGTLVLPLDTDADGLPDAYEDDANLNANAMGNNVLNRFNADVNGNGVPDGSDRLVADGFSAFEKYRGVYLRGPTPGQTGAMTSNDDANTDSVLDPVVTRLGAGMRQMFVRGVGFGSDLDPGFCGVDSAAMPVANNTAIVCPDFAVGGAFAESGIKVVDVSASFSATTRFPRQSLFTPAQPTADMATVVLNGVNCHGGENCDRMSKSGVRQFTFSTLGFSTFGGTSSYGSATVYWRAVKAYFTNRPYQHRTNGPVVTRVEGGAAIPMLLPITQAGDGNDNGQVDRREDTDNTGALIGDTYIAGATDRDLTAVDVNSDGCIELPTVDDPTTLAVCNSGAGTGIFPQATANQVVRSIVTHELGHACGIYTHTSEPLDQMYQYTTNFIRDGHFSQQAADLCNVHNRGAQ